MAAINDHLFFDPASRARTRKIAKMGMDMPEEDKLRPGEVIFRIAHSDRAYDDGVAGLWWIRKDTFDYLCIKSGQVDPDMRPDRAFRRLFRLKLAVAPKFGRSDLIIKARVLDTIRVWTGRGRLIRDDETASTPLSWIGGFEIAQLCIPVLCMESAPNSKRWIRSEDHERMLACDAPIPVYSWFNGAV